jgi:uncharacterized protein (TIGR02217 family)
VSFIESPIFPDSLARGAEGGPMFYTEIVELASGHEQRNVGWPTPRHRYRVSIPTKPTADLQTYRSFFRITKGRGNGFRFRDPHDYQVLVADGRLGVGGVAGAVGTGVLAYQLFKRYTSGSATDDRRIQKPISALATIYRNASPVTVGVSAGNVAVDYATGIATFVPDSTKTITAITQANPGVVTATAHGFSNGNLIYIDSVAGMTQVNGVVFTIAGVTANTFQLGVNTTSYTAYSSGGNAKKGPQAADALTWAGTFHVPVRLESDWFRAVANTARHGDWPDIELLEILIAE